MLDVEFCQGVSQLLKKIHRDWACDWIPKRAITEAANAGLHWSAGNFRVSDEVTTIYDGAASLTKKVHYDYDSSLSDCAPTVALDWTAPVQCVNYTASYGNVTRILDYDWATGAQPGPLLRQTAMTYVTTNPANGNANYLDRLVHIVNKVRTMVVKDAAGNIKAQTEYEYDGSTLTSTGGVPQHDYTNYSTTNRKRGNVTKVRRWLNTNNIWLETVHTYDDLGNSRSTDLPPVSAQ